LRPGEVLLVDVPAVVEGVWLWSWAAPFALQPPFQSSSVPAALTRPEAWFAPQLWASQPVLASLAGAPGVILIRIDEKGVVASRHFIGAQLTEPARQLARAAGTDPQLAWKDFISTLLSQ
jgi:hypothetical protein